MLTLRVQSKDGTKRIKAKQSESVQTLLSKIKKEFELNDDDWTIYQNKERSDEIKKSSRSKLSSKHFKNGDMLYLVYLNQSNVVAGELNQNSLKQIDSGSSSRTLATEDDVDVELWKQDGTIPRNSKHPQGMFKIDDLPIAPWDEEYLKENDIKFLSFHSYMRMETSGVDRGKYLKLDTTKHSCVMKENEEKRSLLDLPTAITLNRQKFRHVDNIMFENGDIADRFIDFWRSSGSQRVGFMFGKYTQHKEVPLGIKAEVCAIYEPPQESSNNYIKLLPDNNIETVMKVANGLGLKPVGWILTDLVAEDRTKGTVKQFRGPDTHFLTAEECVMAGKFQNQFPNTCRLAQNGEYGSKFVTVIVSGDKDQSISFEGYQVSNQGMELIRDDCFVPTIDAPELGYIRESTAEFYVADVYYKMKDEYGNEISKLARPLPLEYLLIDVPSAFSKENLRTCSNDKRGFVVENRMLIGQVQTYSELSEYTSKFSQDEMLEMLSDFHLLIYFATMHNHPISATIEPLLEAIKRKDQSAVMEWCQNAAWVALQQDSQHAQLNEHMNSDEDSDIRRAIQRSLQEI